MKVTDNGCGEERTLEISIVVIAFQDCFPGCVVDEIQDTSWYLLFHVRGSLLDSFRPLLVVA